MKKILSLLLSLVLVFALSATALMEEDGSLNAVKEKGTFILGFDPGFPPMGYTDEKGDYIGFDIDVAKEITARLGVELVLQPIDWAAKELELAGGNIDCIWNGMTVTPEREEAMSLSLPYLENAQIICVLKDSPYNTLADLSGKVLSLQAGSSAEDALNGAAEFKQTLKEVVAFDNNVTALMDLDNQNSDAVLLDQVVANYYIAQKNADYRVLDESLAPEKYAIGFRKGDVALTEEVNNLLLAMAEDGTLAEISTTWFTKDITTIGK